MTAYIDFKYYSSTYLGTAIASTDFDPIALSASIELDSLTYGRVRRAGLSTYSTDTQDLIKTATCLLADALNEIQEATGSASGAVTVTSESVGGYSYSTGGSKAETFDTMMQTARNRVRALLLSTGLLSAAVGGSYRPGWL